MRLKIVVSAIGTVGLLACAIPEMPTPQNGAVLFVENCAICHGVTAQGDGELASDLSPKPSDLTQISVRNGGLFPRAQVLSQIDGYSSEPHSNRVMPEWGELLEGELVPVDIDGVLTPTPRPLAAILIYLEAIQT